MSKIKSEVSYAPTAVFREHFPKEVEKNTKQFIKPTWSLGLEEQLPEKMEEVIEDKHDIITGGLLLVAVLFSAGLLIYVVYNSFSSQ